MKKLTILMLLSFVMVFLAGCPKTPPPPPAEEPVVTQPVSQPEPEPEPEPEPVKEMIREGAFMKVYYDFDKFNLVDSAKAALANNAKILRENPSVIVLIEGHCDERGTVEYNLSLGEKRANAAMTYLKDLGISANRMSIISYGKERPAVLGSNEAAWAKNRRAEFKIVSQ